MSKTFSNQLYDLGISSAKAVIKNLFKATGFKVSRSDWHQQEALVRQYLTAGSIPWSPGYQEARERMIRKILSDMNILESFRRSTPLPDRHGVGFDERSVEIPWLMAFLGTDRERVLDAGSVLNHLYILEQPQLEKKKLDILTLAPEDLCFWKRGISYIFTDLREIPICDSFYDTVVCISTLEHVGFDNSKYTHIKSSSKESPMDFKVVLKELRRVLKPKGRLFLTVPYGIHRDYRLFQQFDHALLSQAIEAFGSASEVVTDFYRHTPHGWNAASHTECAECEYSEMIVKVWLGEEKLKPYRIEADRAAAARAVACVRITKE
jgi:SAM-dependent methyltransferase